jgi:predicted RNase H-like HicB family nuclease
MLSCRKPRIVLRCLQVEVQGHTVEDAPKVELSTCRRSQVTDDASRASRPPSSVVQAIFKAIRRVFRAFETHRDDGAASATWHLTVSTERDELDGGWIAECVELPGCMSQGETEEEAVENLADAIGGILAVRVQAQLLKDVQRDHPAQTRHIHAISVP